MGVGALSSRSFGLALGRFGAVGLISTLTYVVVATVSVRWAALPVLAANTVAYATSGVWSYFGHYYLTFRSDAAHGASVARFFVLFGLGYAASIGIVAADRRLGLPPELGTIMVAGFVPVMNFVVMQLWVFAGRGR